MVNSSLKFILFKRLFRLALRISSPDDSLYFVNILILQFHTIFTDLFLQILNTNFEFLKFQYWTIFTRQIEIKRLFFSFSSNSSLQDMDSIFTKISQVSIFSDIDMTIGDQDTIVVATESCSPFNDHRKS